MEKNKMLILLPLVSTIFIVAFYGATIQELTEKRQT